ncbi:helix-turn-helix domain-containing protein [Rheinheimera baltica]|uniref:helix-turn-helix domain-containing protein n=1 Tax=Rheinheimera baltica TaxID=67576 RepID=UPI0003FF4AC7|nr:helix-turn-helix domain-containing protein [Rheinheimera baltica]
MLTAESLLSSFTLVCALLLALLQLKRLYPVAHIAILSAILVLFIFTRLDDMLQVSGLLETYPGLLFIGSVTFLLLGPLIYHYVIARTSAQNVSCFNYRALRHTLVTLPPVLYLVPYWWWQTTPYQLEMLQSGGLLTPLNMLLWPSYGDLVLLFYLGLCVKRLQQFGVVLKHWFSFVEDKNLAGLKNILQWLALIIVVHLVWTWVTWFDINIVQSTISSVLIVAQLMFILALVLEAVASGKRDIILPPPEHEAASTTPYTDAQIQQTAQLIQQRVEAEKLYLDANLTLNRLARILQQPQKRVSLALNQTLGKTFYDYINGSRISHAKTLITQQPELNLLDIAMQSGFNSKSVFNSAFNKYAQTTPSNYRRQHASTNVQ